MRLWQSFLKEKQVPQRVMVPCLNANQVGVYIVGNICSNVKIRPIDNLLKIRSASFASYQNYS